MNKYYASILFFIISSVSMAGDLQTKLYNDHHAFISTDIGRVYEAKAIKAFWSNPSFMQKCAPANTPIAESFHIYYIVELDGSISNMHLFPETEVAKCIKRNILNNISPKPHEIFIGSIKMNFTK